MDNLSKLNFLLKLQLDIGDFYDKEIEKQNKNKYLFKRTEDMLERASITLKNLDDLTKEDMDCISKEFEEYKKEFELVKS